MEIWKKYDSLECGINDDGMLFIGDNRSGYNLPDTPANRAYIIENFERELGYIGYKHAGSISKHDVVYELYRKIENGRGKWLAEDTRTGEFFPITYEQALGYEPIRPTGIEKLSRELGKMLLPKRA